MANAKIVNTPSQAIPQTSAVHTQRTVGAASGDVINFSLQNDTTHVVVQFNNATCRVRFDGTAPTSSIGFKFTDGGTAYWTRQMALKAKAIRQNATDVVVEIQELNFL